MTRPSHPPRDAGVSLVESLASLVIVSMLALMLVSGLTTGRAVWKHTDARQSGAESLETAQNLLRDRLERTYAKSTFETFDTYTDFRGGRAALEFLADPPDAGRPGAVRRYRLEVTPDGDLVLTSSHELGGAGVAPVVRQTLLSGVREMDLAYFGESKADGRRSWREDWALQPAPPELVRIRIAFGPGDKRVWPELLVRPLANVDTACHIDMSYHRCKGRG